MKILAIETIDLRGSVAALDEDRLLVEQPLDPAKRSAQSLAPAIDALLHQLGWQPKEVELISVATGPGSFTGLRIGVTTAKAFAYAIGAQVIGVNTMLALASQAPAGTDRVTVILDAQREELFAAEMSRKAGGGWSGHEQARIVSRLQWLQELTSGSIVTGPVVSRLAQDLPKGVQKLEESAWILTAAMIGRVGWQQYCAGQRNDAFALVPEYLRRTAAEEQWDRKQGG